MSIKNIISTVFINDTDMATSFNSSALSLIRAPGFTIQLVFTGSPVGTFKLQFSSDDANTESGIINWSDIPGSSQAITEAGNHSWIETRRYKWLRVVYTRSSGTGSVDGSIFAIEEH